MSSRLLRRVIQVLTGVVIAACAVGGFLGLRALVWRQGYQVAGMVESGIVISLGVAGAFGVVYFLLGGLLSRLMRIDWLSVQVGALLGALLYGGYNAITPLTRLSVGETPAWRALQGGVDGLWIGALLGLATLFISARALHLDRAGLTRYVILYVTVILMAWLILWVQTLLRLPEVVGLIVALPLLAVLRLAVGVLDRRVDHSRLRNYGYDEGS
jgi:hypothetical protein